MEIEIPLEKCYNAPEGNFRAEFIEIREKVDANKKQVRLTFDPHLPVTKNKEILLGATFDKSLAKGSKLRVFLENWLGKDFFEKRKKVDLEKLKGTFCDLKVVHFVNQGHEHPFCHLQESHPPGTLVSNYGYEQQKLPPPIPNEEDNALAA